VGYSPEDLSRAEHHSRMAQPAAPTHRNLIGSTATTAAAIFVIITVIFLAIIAAVATAAAASA